jgi:Spy/CpxP family protein refolding chaperone
MHSLVLSVLLAASSPAFAGDDTLDAATSLGSGRFAEIADRLALTTEQRTEVADAVYLASSARVDVEARVEKARLDLRHLLGADAVDEKAVLRAVETLNTAESDLRKNRVQLVLAIRRVLTPDQWRGLVALHGEQHAGQQ